MPFKLHLNLRARFILALLVVATLLSGGYYYAVHEFVEVLEDELGTQSLVRELNDFTEYYAKNPAAPPIARDRIQTYVYKRNQAAADLPPPLAKWENGHSGEFRWHGIEYQAIRHDIGDTRVYMTLSLSRVEDLESRLVAFAWVFISCALLLSAIAGAGLSLLVTRPVSRLAHMVTDLHPAERGRTLADQFGDHEVGQIAHAFDQYLGKIDDYVKREKAFTDDASHELRTPLTIIMNAAQLLDDDPQLSASSRERLARISRAATQMQALIEALLFLAREDGGIARDRCPMDEILSESVEALSQQRTGAALQIHLDIGAQPIVQAPRAMVSCVMQNLISNAMQHGGEGRIDVRLHEREFVVQDMGSGIPEAALERIFERRYRGTDSHGLGLGLYIVQRICKRLGWKIDVGNVDGAGARFVVRFKP